MRLQRRKHPPLDQAFNPPAGGSVRGANIRVCINPHKYVMCARGTARSADKCLRMREEPPEVLLQAFLKCIQMMDAQLARFHKDPVRTPVSTSHTTWTVLWIRRRTASQVPALIPLPQALAQTELGSSPEVVRGNYLIDKNREIHTRGEISATGLRHVRNQMGQIEERRVWTVNHGGAQVFIKNLGKVFHDSYAFHPAFVFPLDRALFLRNEGNLHK